MADPSGQETTASSAWKPLLLIALLLPGLWLTTRAVDIIDRALRTEIVDGVGPIGPLHVAADGRLIFADCGVGGEVPDPISPTQRLRVASDGELIFADCGTRGKVHGGQLVALDPTSKRWSVVLDGLVQPRAGDLSPAGVACAATEGLSNRPSTVVCSNGLDVDLDAYVSRHPGPAGLPGHGPPAQPVDLLSDGGDGWFVAEAGTNQILHLAGDGSISVVASVGQHRPFSIQPVGLARDAKSLWVTLGQSGFAAVPLSTRNGDIMKGQILGGRFSIAVVPRASQPLVLVLEELASVSGFVTYPIESEWGIGPRVVADLVSPTGLALLSDGRLALAADGQLTLFRTRSLP